MLLSNSEKRKKGKKKKIKILKKSRTPLRGVHELLYYLKWLFQNE